MLPPAAQVPPLPPGAATGRDGKVIQHPSELLPCLHSWPPPAPQAPNLTKEKPDQNKHCGGRGKAASLLGVFVVFWCFVFFFLRDIEDQSREPAQWKTATWGLWKSELRRGRWERSNKESHNIQNTQAPTSARKAVGRDCGVIPGYLRLPRQTQSGSATGTRLDQESLDFFALSTWNKMLSPRGVFFYYMEEIKGGQLAVRGSSSLR